MAEINEVINFIKNMSLEMIIDIWIAIAIVIVFRILRGTFAYIVIKMFKFKEKNSKKIKANAFYEPLRSFFGFLGIYLAILLLAKPFNISQEAIDIVTKIFKIIVIITTAVGLANSITTKSAFMAKIQEKSEEKIDKSTLKFIIKAIKAVIYLIAGFLTITELGYNLNGLIAGLGIGSVVITLAAQDTAKNLFGGLTIMLDKPFKIGDTIKVGTQQGVVEDLSFRSTRVRIEDGSLVYIPNAEIAAKEVVNCSQKVRTRYKKVITLSSSISLEKLDRCKLKLLQVFHEYELVDKNSIVVAVKDISNNGIDLLVDCFIDSLDAKQVSAITEEFNYKIMQIINCEGIEFAG